MRYRKSRSVLIAAIATSLWGGAGVTYAQTAPARGAAPTAPATMPAPPTAPGTVPATPAVPGLTNPVPPLPANAPNTVVPAVPPLSGQPLTPAPTLPGNQPLNAQANAGMRVPTRADSALTAFRSLDPSNRGYVTRAEIDRIPGFTGFDNADANRDGQLSPDEFATAWKFYSGQ
jgi:hypothetical protein